MPIDIMSVDPQADTKDKFKGKFLEQIEPGIWEPSLVSGEHVLHQPNAFGDEEGGDIPKREPERIIVQDGISLFAVARKRYREQRCSRGLSQLNRHQTARSFSQIKRADQDQGHRHIELRRGLRLS